MLRAFIQDIRGKREVGEPPSLWRTHRNTILKAINMRFGRLAGEDQIDIIAAILECGIIPDLPAEHASIIAQTAVIALQRAAERLIRLSREMLAATIFLAGAAEAEGEVASAASRLALVRALMRYSTLRALMRDGRVIANAQGDQFIVAAARHAIPHFVEWKHIAAMSDKGAPIWGGLSLIALLGAGGVELPSSISLDALLNDLVEADESGLTKEAAVDFLALHMGR